MSAAPTRPALKLGDQFTVVVQDIGFGGEGVVRVNDFVVFVPFVITGETVRLEISEVKSSFARGRLLEVVQPSPDRIKADCRYFTECGGCQYQHITYARQLEIKRKQIADLLQRVGGLSPELVTPVVPCSHPWNYRNRIMIRSQWNKPEQRLNIGFLREDSGLVVDIDECKIAEPALNEQIKQVRLKPPPKGGIKVTLRVMPEGWELPADSFFQTNSFMLGALVGTVRDALKRNPTRFLVDAYCGVGFFSIELADLVEWFVGVEVDLMAIRAARKNLASRKLTNGEYFPGATEELLPDILLRFPPAETTIVLDPPRAGCPKESLEQLRASGIAQILYVSCHPATLARDLNILARDGVFEITRVTPHDMFPHTQHVECVAELRRK